MKSVVPQAESDDDFWGGEKQPVKSQPEKLEKPEVSRTPRPLDVPNLNESQNESKNSSNVPPGAIDYVPKSQSRQSFRNRPGSARSVTSPRLNSSVDHMANLTTSTPPKLLEKVPEVQRKKSESSAKLSSDESSPDVSEDEKSPKYSEAFDSDQPNEVESKVTVVKTEKKLVKKATVPTVKTVKKVTKEPTSNSIKTAKSADLSVTKPTGKKTKLDVSMSKVRGLQDEITFLKTQLEDLSTENRTIKSIQKRQERQLLHNDRSGTVTSEVQNVLETHAEETRYLREHLKKQQDKNRESERILRERNDALQQAIAKTKRLEELLTKKGIDPKSKPKAKNLEVLESQLEEERKKTQHLEREKELLVKNHRHQLSIEVQRHKETQRKLIDTEAELEKLREKARRTDLDALYTSRGTTIRTKVKQTDSRLSTSLNQSKTVQKPAKAEPTKLEEKKLIATVIEEEKDKKANWSADSGRADSIKSHEGNLSKSFENYKIKSGSPEKAKSPEKQVVDNNNIDDILGLKRSDSTEKKVAKPIKETLPDVEQPAKKKDEFLDSLFSNSAPTPKNTPVMSPPNVKNEVKIESKGAEQPSKSGKDLLDDLFGPKIVKRSSEAPKSDYQVADVVKPDKKKPSSDVANLFGSIDKTTKMPWD